MELFKITKMFKSCLKAKLINTQYMIISKYTKFKIFILIRNKIILIQFKEKKYVKGSI